MLQSIFSCRIIRRRVIYAKTKREQMLKAKDFMTEVVLSVRRDTPVEEALELLLEHKISGMPVVEEDMTLVGIVTEKDLLRLLFEPQGVKGKTVEGFMTHSAVNFEEDETIEEICQYLDKVSYRRVPVTKEGKVVGIVSRSDIIRCILDLSRGKVDVYLKKHEGFTSTEIVENMDTSVESVESLIHRAKKNLQKALNQYYREKV